MQGSFFNNLFDSPRNRFWDYSRKTRCCLLSIISQYFWVHVRVPYKKREGIYPFAFRILIMERLGDIYIFSVCSTVLSVGILAARRINYRSVKFLYIFSLLLYRQSPQNGKCLLHFLEDKKFRSIVFFKIHFLRFIGKIYCIYSFLTVCETVYVITSIEKPSFSTLNRPICFC
jgi:hypothetical protein